jgi:hypothetical protein
MNSEAIAILSLSGKSDILNEQSEAQNYNNER